MQEFYNLKDHIDLIVAYWKEMNNSSVDEVSNQSINQSTNQSINQPTNQNKQEAKQKLRRVTIGRISKVQKLLGLDMIVRLPSGDYCNHTNTTPIDMLRMVCLSLPCCFPASDLVCNRSTSKWQTAFPSKTGPLIQWPIRVRSLHFNLN